MGVLCGYKVLGFPDQCHQHLALSSAEAELYACAVCGSSGMVMVGLAMTITGPLFYDKLILFTCVFAMILKTGLYQLFTR